MLWLVQPLSKKMSRHVGAEMLGTGNVWSLHKCTTRLFQAACELGKLSAHGGTSCLVPAPLDPEHVLPISRDCNLTPC